MLFNSPAFLFAFLPVVLIVFGFVRHRGRWALICLVAASFVFYAQWSVPYLGLLIVLMIANYWIGKALGVNQSRLILSLGVALNLAVLGYFKYTNFLIEIISEATGITAGHFNILLPLGISFFIFQKIAYLVDIYQKRIAQHDFVDYCLFVSFFPQLIAGPIVHAREVMPQFSGVGRSPLVQNIAIGGTIFVIGLAKKMLLADTFALIANPVFNTALDRPPHLVVAWAGAVAYGLQIYFDFSGYSDMAIGLARMFGITLPVNFASPYKSRSIIEFWRRWHITLTRSLTDYIYSPIALSLARRGVQAGAGRVAFFALSVLIPVNITFLVSGIWHGAGWTFVLWGALHGIGLALNQAWCEFGWRKPMPPLLARLLTFTFVTLLWVPFRSASLDAAGTIWSGMIGLNGIYNSGDLGSYGKLAWPLLPVGLMIAFFAPNTQTLMREFHPILEHERSDTDIDRDGFSSFLWHPLPRFAFVVGIFLAVCSLKLNDVSAFIYFQF